MSNYNQQNGSQLDSDAIGRRLVALEAVSSPRPALAYAYLSNSSGAVTGSGSTLTIPSLETVSGQKIFDSAQTTLTVPLPSLTCATVAAGTPTISQSPQQLAKLNLAVNNTSGGAVSGNVTISGNDERGVPLSDTVAIASTANNSTSNTVSNKYFTSISSISVSGTLGNTNVNITITEYQFRGHVKIGSDGVPAFAWNNTFAFSELKICTFEVLAAGILSVQDWRLLGPQPKANRVGEIVDFCGGMPEGPPYPWQGTCVYCLCECVDGHIIIAGNGGAISEFDGQKFISYIQPITGLTGSDHITACFNLGRNSLGKEIIFFGTVTGILIRWNRTDNTYSTVAPGAWVAGKQYSQILKGPGNSFAWAIGGSGYVFLISENGTSATQQTYTSNVGFSTGDLPMSAAWHARHLYVGGGTGTGMQFQRFNMENLTGINLSTYLPGTPAERGTGAPASVPAIYAMGVSPHGKLLLAGIGNSAFWLAEWDHNQQFATGKLQLTTSGAATIPAGTTYSNGTVQYKTMQACSTTGAGTVIVPATATVSGDAGFAVASTVTTIVDAVANVTAVTNTTPFGMGKFIGSGPSATGEEGLPAAVVANNPLGLCWTGELWLIVMQGGDVLTYDGSRLHRITERFSFKGRATAAFRATTRTWVVGDEGKVFALPH